MTKNKPLFLHLTMSINQIEYVLGTLSFNQNKAECSYHFTHPHDGSPLHLNCDTGKYTARFEHITWHKDVVHIKREDNVAVERVKATHGPLFLDQRTITAVYVESLYFEGNKPCAVEAARFTFWKGGQSQKILDLSASSGFSIIYLLVPADLDTRSILVGTQFLETPHGLNFPPCLADLCDKQHRPGRIQLWKNWDFLVIPSPFKCRVLSPLPDAMASGFRLPNYRHTQAALTDLLLQANKVERP